MILCYKLGKKTHMEYVDMVGFDVRMGTTRVIDGILSQRRMVCAKQGFYSPIIVTKQHYMSLYGKRITSIKHVQTCGSDYDSLKVVKCFVI